MNEEVRAKDCYLVAIFAKRVSFRVDFAILFDGMRFLILSWLVLLNSH